LQDVKISSEGISAASSSEGGSSNLLPVAVALVLVLLFVGFWVYNLKRNKK
jgi:flagellar biogenesis protein FliO